MTHKRFNFPGDQLCLSDAQGWRVTCLATTSAAGVDPGSGDEAPPMCPIGIIIAWPRATSRFTGSTSQNELSQTGWGALQTA